jgi:hypothetical protein
VLGWEPRVSLREGLVTTYYWIESELRVQEGFRNLHRTYRLNNLRS